MFYGWIVTFTGFIVCVIGMGARYSFGIFFDSLELEFGLSRALTSGIFSVYMILCSVIAILGGWALDKYGPRSTILLMSVFTGLSFVLTSFVTHPLQLIFTYGILLAFGTGSVYSSVNSTVSRWFIKKRGVAVGFASSGGGVGLIVVAPVASYLILRFEWRLAYLVLGFAAGGLMLIAALFLRKDPAEMGLLPDGETIPSNESQSSGHTSEIDEAASAEVNVLKTKQFWLLSAIWFFISVGLHMVMVHTVTYATDHQISPIKAATVMSVIGFMNIFSRLPVGKLTDKFGVRLVGIICTLIQCVNLLGLNAAHTLWQLYIFAVVFGLMWGGIGTATTVLVSEIFGTRRLGFIMGITSAAWAIGAAIGPTFGGYLYDISSSYLIAFTIAAIAHLCASLFLVWIKPLRPSESFG